MCTPPRPEGAERRAKVATAELASRAGVLYRLGFSQAAAIWWFTVAVVWEYDIGAPRLVCRRPVVFSDQAIV